MASWISNSIYVGLDVSTETTSICVIDDKVRRGKGASRRLFGLGWRPNSSPIG